MRSRHIGKETIKRLDADLRQHVSRFGCGMWYVAHGFADLSSQLAAFTIGGISGGIHQRVQLSDISNTNLDHPASAVRVGIYDFGLVFHLTVDIDVLAIHSAIQLGGGFDRFDFAEGIARR